MNSFQASTLTKRGGGGGLAERSSVVVYERVCTLVFAVIKNIKRTQRDPNCLRRHALLGPQWGAVVQASAPAPRVVAAPPAHTRAAAK